MTPQNICYVETVADLLPVTTPVEFLSLNSESCCLLPNTWEIPFDSKSRVQCEHDATGQSVMRVWLIEQSSGQVVPDLSASLRQMEGEEESGK